MCVGQSEQDTKGGREGGEGGGWRVEGRKEDLGTSDSSHTIQDWEQRSNLA